MYVCNFGGKGRNLTLQGNVIDVTFVLQSSFFCLATKERSKKNSSRPGETMRMGAVIGGHGWLVFGLLGVI